MRTIASILFAAATIMAMASAACPNQCSGHGKCSDDDKCICFKQTGTTWRQRVGWTGPDCSQRTCPLGIAFDTLSTERGVEITPVKFNPGKAFGSTTANTNTATSTSFVFGAKSSGAIAQLGESKNFAVRISSETDNGGTPGTAESGDKFQFQWKLDTHTSYSAPQDFVTFDGTNWNGCTQMTPCELVSNEAVTTTGIYIYLDTSALVDDDAVVDASTGLEVGNVFEFSYDNQEGRPYEYGEENNAHQQVECSGRGSCDRASGRCACENNYSGEACQRLECPNQCSGHGICQDLRRFASDASMTYSSAYDARKNMGCLCDEGFRGPDCSMIECPSGADPMGGFGGDGTDEDGTVGPAMDCSGRGTCDYSSGLCQCFKGFTGTRCENQIAAFV